MQSNEENDNISQNEEEQYNLESNEKNINQESDNNQNKLNQERNDNQKIKNTSEGDDLMNKLNEEADKIHTEVNKDNLKMLTKYANLSEEELQDLIKEKNAFLLTLNEEKETSKRELNKIIKSLNEIIATNSEILYHKEPDPHIMKQLERVIEIRKKDLQMSKKTNQTFKSQYDVISSKSNTKLSVERLNAIELKIDLIKKENADLIRKTRELRNKNSIQSKELEICSDNKVHPKKILSYTNEIKSLASKKHEYHIKLSSNKKSLTNTLKELKKLEDLHYSFLSEETTETIAKKISEWIIMIKSDLDGTEEEILNRAEQCSSKVLNAMERERKKNKDIQTVLPIVNSGFRARSSSPKTKDHSSQKTALLNNPRETQPYKGIFNKFAYLKPKGKLPHYMTNSSQGKREKEEIKSENIDITDIIEYDYDNTTNADYRELLNKKELYVEINQRIEKSIKELEKMSDKKLKDISGTIDSNARRLNSLQQQNNFIQLEIANLSKILSLNLEQSRIRKEINHNESKMYKMNNPLLQHTSNDASMTGNDLSQELNYLKDEEEKKRSFQPTSSNIIEEENEHNAKQRINEMEHVDSNKNIRFPDISNVEKIDDDGMMDREKRLMEIKNKYISMEKENEEVEKESNKGGKGQIEEEDKNNQGEEQGSVDNEKQINEEEQVNEQNNDQLQEEENQEGEGENQEEEGENQEGEGENQEGEGENQEGEGENQEEGNNNGNKQQIND